MAIVRVLCFLLVTTVLVWAQGSTAQINGIIRDDSGLAVPGADVSVTQTSTSATRTTTSGPDGSYAFQNLPIGPYVLEITKSGFNKYVQNGIVLEVDANRTIEVALKVGATSDEVTVQADVVAVETQSTGVGTVVDNQRVNEMPLNGRNVTELIFLAGMATVGTGNAAQLVSVRNYPTIVLSVAGGTGNGNTYLLDGAPYNEIFTNQNYPLPFPDALLEFKVETSALPAQYGFHSAAAVNAVTKSGSNQFHGDAFEFLRNGDFNARDFFATSRDTLKRNQFGGTVGGPILKNKLFFMAGYQGTVQKSSPASTIAYVPTAMELAGNFTVAASAACNGKSINLPLADGFVNNQIAPSMINPAALKIASYLPATTNPCGKTTYALLANQTENLGVTRVDYQKSERHTIFGRLEVSNLDLPSTFDGKDPLTINATAALYRVYALALGDTFLFSPSLVNSFHVSANRMEIAKPVDDFASWRDLGVNADDLAGNSIRLTVGGNGFSIGGSSNSAPNVANQGPTPSFGDDVSWVHGTHQIGFGGIYMRSTMNFFSGINPLGLMNFSGSVTGLAMADFLTGAASSWSQGNFNRWYQRQDYISLYIQDSWRITQRITLNYGLRWEPYTSPWSKYGEYVHFDPTLFSQNVHSTVYANAPAGLIFPGDPQYTAGNSPSKSDWNTWAPRFGIAWDPFGNGKTSIRAAWGIFTDRQGFQAYSAFTGNAPFGDQINLANVNLSNPWASYPGGDPFPLPSGSNAIFPLAGAYRSDPLDYKPTYLNQWNLSLQHQLGSSWLVSANYIGNNTIHLITGTEANPAVFLGLGACTINNIHYSTCSTTSNTNQRRVLYLQNPAQGKYYSFINDLDDGGTASYNGLLLSAQKRLSHNFSALANYTWSHCISDYWEAQVGTSNVVNIPGDRRAYRSNCSTGDQRQILNLSLIAQTPKFSSRALRLIASDWQVSPIMTIRSAQFFTVTNGGQDVALTGQPTQTPNQILANPYPAHQSVNQWIMASAFGPAAPGTYGDLGLNNLKGPGVFQLDLAVTRNFPIFEKQVLQLRAEAFNLPNHFNPSTPVATTNSGAFGQIQSDISGTQGLNAGDPRIIQFALKYIF